MQVCAQQRGLWRSIGMRAVVSEAPSKPARRSSPREAGGQDGVC